MDCSLGRIKLNGRHIQREEARRNVVEKVLACPLPDPSPRKRERGAGYTGKGSRGKASRRSCCGHSDSDDPGTATAASTVCPGTPCQVLKFLRGQITLRRSIFGRLFRLL